MFNGKGTYYIKPLIIVIVFSLIGFISLFFAKDFMEDFDGIGVYLIVQLVLLVILLFYKSFFLLTLSYLNLSWLAVAFIVSRIPTVQYNGGVGGLAGLIVGMIIVTPIVTGICRVLYNKDQKAG